MPLGPDQFKHIQAGGSISSADYNRMVDTVAALSRSGGDNCFVDSSGVLRRRNPASAGVDIRIFKVVTAGTGDGIYNCYEQVLDEDQWANAGGVNKFVNLNTTSIEVLNLAEFDAESDYVAHLQADDIIAAWQKADDEGNLRWQGMPFRKDRSPRMAWTSQAAPAGKVITATLDSTSGTAINVYCEIADGGADLNTSLPRLRDNEIIFVAKINNADGDYWRCLSIFQPDEECVCTEAE